MSDKKNTRKRCKPSVPAQVAIVQSATYWYFIVDLITALRREFKISDTTFADYLKTAGLDDLTANLHVQLFSGDPDIKGLAEKVFSHLPYGKEQEIFELTLDAMLTNAGYSHATPDTRARMGRKMFEAVTTELVDHHAKLLYVEMIGTSMIYRRICS